jgi:hypothetical protein
VLDTNERLHGWDREDFRPRLAQLYYSLGETIVTCGVNEMTRWFIAAAEHGQDDAGRSKCRKYAIISRTVAHNAAG